MAIREIEAMQPLAAFQETKGPASKIPAGEPGLFGSIFESAINNVKETNAEKVNAQYLLATGQLDNPAMLSLASAKAGLASSLLIQLRDRAMSVYSELTRISL